MPEFPLPDGGTWETSPSSGSNQVAVTPGAANTKSAAWATIIAATLYESRQLVVFLGMNDNAADGLVDIAVGAAASEVIIVANLKVDLPVNSGYVATVYHLPMAIPAGSRLSAKVQCTNGATNGLHVGIMLAGRPVGGDLDNSCRSETWGAVTADSGGTSVDPGASANVVGVWSELVATTSFDVRQIVIAIGNQVNTARRVSSFLLDIGVGAGGSEIVVLKEMALRGALNFNVSPTVLGPFPVNIPAGSRVAARLKSSINDATDRIMDVIVYGFA